MFTLEACYRIASIGGLLVWVVQFDHSDKKRKISLESNLDRVLVAAELEFSKILVPRLPQHTSNVNTECAGKSE